MKQISMYFKSDFTVILASEGEWGGCPFRIKLWTASPAEGRSIKACFDGEVWHNCRLLDDGRLQISVNQGDLGERQYMGIGTLKMDIEFYLTNADFNDHYCNEHIKTLDPVFEDENGEQYKLYLDNQGASTITTIGTLPAFYQRGEKGERGERGEQGLPGEQGPKGDKGDKGDRGEQGIQGVKGDTGPKGATGPQGQRGIQGIQGRKGETGETGATGPQGERGLQGEKGEKGEPFHYSDFTPEQLEGLRGPRGYQGETGPAGPVGPQGPQGERGPKGDSVTMFPAVTIFGQPRIQETQMSEFSAANYAQFPFLVDFAGRHWQLDCAITTGADVSQQHNVFDSAFGLAFAFSGGKFVLAMSSNGTSWNLGATSGTHSILANTTYYIRITWDGSAYVLAYSTDKVNWTNDITVASAESLASKQIIIGKSLDNAHIFNGSINFAEARLTIANVIVWEGMEEVGTATRMAIDMSNIDEAGKQKVNDIVGEGAVGQAIADLNARQGAYPAFPDLPLTLAVSGKVIGTDGQLVTKAGYGISAPVEVQKGNTYRFPSSEAIGGHALFAQVLTREVQYTITMQSYTEGTETRERIERISTMRGIGGIGRVYRCVYSGDNDTIVGIWQDSAEDGYSYKNLPVVGEKSYAILNPKMLDGTPMTSELLYADITSAAGGQVAVRPSYTEYSPKFNANGVVSLTANGEYVLLSSFEGLMVVSGKLSDLAEGKVLHQSRDGKDASLANQISQMLITNTKQELTEQQKAQGRENLDAAAAYVESELNEKAWKRDLGFIAGQSNMLIWEDIYGKIHIESGAFKSRKAQSDNVFATTGKRLIAGNISGNSGEIAFLFGVQITQTNWEEIIPQLIVTDKCTSLQFALSCLQHVKDLSFVKYWDTKNVITIAGCFNQCTADEIDVSSWDLTSMISLGGEAFSTFGSIKKIIGLDKWDTSNITAMGNVFNGSQLEEIPVSEWNTSSVTNMPGMFYNANKVIKIDLHKWDTSLVESFGNFIYGCSRLTNLDIRGLNCSSMKSGNILSYGNPLLTNILGGSQSLNEQTFVGLKISQPVRPAIDYPSARAILNGIATIEDGSKPVLTFVASTYNMLTDADFAIADSKGWQIAKG